MAVTSPFTSSGIGAVDSAVISLPLKLLVGPTKQNLPCDQRNQKAVGVSFAVMSLNDNNLKQTVIHTITEASSIPAHHGLFAIGQPVP